MKPRRIQLKRTRGWRLPPNSVVVARPTRWGNPFRVGGWYRWVGGARGAMWREATQPGVRGSTLIVDQAMAVEWFARLMDRKRPDLHELRGKNLACWCQPGTPCHADVLLKLATRR